MQQPDPSHALRADAPDHLLAGTGRRRAVTALLTTHLLLITSCQTLLTTLLPTRCCVRRDVCHGYRSALTNKHEEHGPRNSPFFEEPKVGVGASSPRLSQTS